MSYPMVEWVLVPFGWRVSMHTKWEAQMQLRPSYLEGIPSGDSKWGLA